MNIFVLDRDPIIAAQMYCDKHVPKMVVELYQQLGSALRIHGAHDRDMPLTQKGTPLKGGYAKHPCTLWVSMNRTNFTWALTHARALCREYVFRFHKKHFCQSGIEKLAQMTGLLPDSGQQTEFPQAMPEQFQQPDVVAAYRSYYCSKEFASWQKGREAPYWWQARPAP